MAPILALALALGSAFAHADDLQEASRLLRAGQHEQALDRVDRVLSAKPRDAQARFLKGIILTEQGNARQAVEIFQRLTHDYPELPEPYNNLAVIYAAQGQYDKARAALEQSIRTHPSYATAYENLGDVYAKLASQAYDRALQLDSSNAGAQNKLALVRDLVGGPATQRAQAAKPAAGQPVAVAAAPQAAVKPAPAAEKPTAAAPGKPAAAPDKPAAAPEKPAAAPEKPAPAGEPKTAAAKPAPAAPEKPAAATQTAAVTAKPSPKEPVASSANAEQAILKAVEGWAKAWSARDIEGYLGFYARSFDPGDGESRADWEKLRRVRVTAPKRISVTVSSAEVTINDAKTAKVVFHQSYKSDRFNGDSTKTLVMVNEAGQWRIQQERVGN